MHIGHEAVIRKMIEDFGDNCMVVIGSDNSPMSLRHFFCYEDRRRFVKTVFPQVKIVGLADFQSDAEWLTALDDLIDLAGADPNQTAFYGGCEEDVIYYAGLGRKIRILNRFDGSTAKISATEVRDALIHDRPLDSLISAKLTEGIKEIFGHKWEIFKRL